MEEQIGWSFVRSGLLGVVAYFDVLQKQSQ
jgi:hypothetical protein